jgi:hypothetical protein
MDITTNHVPQCSLRDMTKLNHCVRLRALHLRMGSPGDINDGVWCCADTAACLKACGTGTRAKEVSEETACLHVQSLWTMCGWVLAEHGESQPHTDAIAVYKAVAADMYSRRKEKCKRRAEDPDQQRWTQFTARDELRSIHKKLGAEYIRILQMDGASDEDRAAAITRLLRCAVLFGVDPSDHAFPCLRGGNWPLVRYGEPGMHPSLARKGHWLDMTDEGAVLHAPFSTKPRPDMEARPIAFNVDELSPKIGTLLVMLQPHAELTRDGWVFPPQTRSLCLYHRSKATKALLGQAYTANDGRHLSYCAEHGNPCERAVKAARRGSTAAAAACYGGGRC